MTEAAHEGTERASSAALVGVEEVTHSSLKSGVSDAGMRSKIYPSPSTRVGSRRGARVRFGLWAGIITFDRRERVRQQPASALGLSRLPLTGACGGSGHCGRVPGRLHMRVPVAAQEGTACRTAWEGGGGRKGEEDGVEGREDLNGLGARS